MNIFNDIKRIASALEYQNLLLSIIAGHLTGQSIPSKPIDSTPIENIKPEKFEAKLSIYDDNKVTDLEDWLAKFRLTMGREPDENEVNRFRKELEDYYG